MSEKQIKVQCPKCNLYIVLELEECFTRQSYKVCECKNFIQFHNADVSSIEDQKDFFSDITITSN